MPGQLFEKGQEVVLITRQIWMNLETKVITTGPVPEDIYHVLDYQWDTDHNQWFISLDEFGAGIWYPERYFAPVLGDSDLAVMLEEEVMV